jgi:hypothetical protein
MLRKSVLIIILYYEEFLAIFQTAFLHVTYKNLYSTVHTGYLCNNVNEFKYKQTPDPRNFCIFFYTINNNCE